jgi:hypothetical protein
MAADQPPGTRFRTLPVVPALYPAEVPMAQALLAEHLIPAGAEIRQIARASPPRCGGVAVAKGLGCPGSEAGRQAANANHPLWLPPHRHTVPTIVGSAAYLLVLGRRRPVAREACWDRLVLGQRWGQHFQNRRTPGWSFGIAARGFQEGPVIQCAKTDWPLGPNPRRRNGRQCGGVRESPQQGATSQGLPRPTP